MLLQLHSIPWLLTVESAPHLLMCALLCLLCRRNSHSLNSHTMHFSTKNLRLQYMPDCLYHIYCILSNFFHPSPSMVSPTGLSWTCIVHGANIMSKWTSWIVRSYTSNLSGMMGLCDHSSEHCRDAFLWQYPADLPAGMLLLCKTVPWMEPGVCRQL